MSSQEFDQNDDIRSGIRLPQSEIERIKKLQAWTQNLSRDQAEALASLPVRRDLLTFLKYLGENRVVGTSSTGNLPLKHVRLIVERFVEPVEVDTSIGDRVYKLRTEDEVWPLLYIHMLAVGGGLLIGGTARPWLVTSLGSRFPDLPAPVQVHYLLFTWWHHCDWTAASPSAGSEDGLPGDFKPAALACLSELPAGKESPYEEFADQVIRRGGLTRPGTDPENARMILHRAIRRMVIEPLASFGVLEPTYIQKYADVKDRMELKTIRLTPMGRDLLELL